MRGPQVEAAAGLPRPGDGVRGGSARRPAEREGRTSRPPSRPSSSGGWWRPACRSSRPPRSCRPSWVPQLGDAAELLAGPRAGGARPQPAGPGAQREGLDRALEAGVQAVAVFGSATETFARNNLGRSVDESIEMFRPVVARARAAGLWVRGYVSMCFGDPWEGDVPVDQVVDVAARLDDLGCDRALPGRHDRRRDDRPRAPAARGARRPRGSASSTSAVHFHDTYGQALANTLAALADGVTVVDCVGRRPRRLPLRQERDRQPRHRGPRLGAGRRRRRDRRRPRPPWSRRASGWPRQLGRPSPSRVVTALAGPDQLIPLDRRRTARTALCAS